MQYDGKLNIMLFQISKESTVHVGFVCSRCGMTSKCLSQEVNGGHNISKSCD